MQTALAAAEASANEGPDSSVCRDALEYTLAMLSVKQGKAADQLLLYEQRRTESRLSLHSASDDESEGHLVAAEDSYQSFQVGNVLRHADTGSLGRHFWAVLLCLWHAVLLCCKLPLRA